MKLEEIRSTVDEIEYRGWWINVVEDGDFGYLQVAFHAEDSDTGILEVQRGRKWKLSPHMTRSEVVQTAFKAILTAEEHEARERFTYRGTAVFGPHLDVERLVALARHTDGRPTVPA